MDIPWHPLPSPRPPHLKWGPLKFKLCLNPSYWVLSEMKLNCEKQVHRIDKWSIQRVCSSERLCLFRHHHQRSAAKSIVVKTRNKILCNNCVLSEIALRHTEEGGWWFVNGSSIITLVHCKHGICISEVQDNSLPAVCELSLLPASVWVRNSSFLSTLTALCNSVSVKRICTRSWSSK